MTQSELTALSIVVVSFNTAALLEQCLQSCLASPPPGGLELIVVDNASQDDSVTRARALGPSVRVVTNAHNIGYARANNLGLQSCRGRHVLLLNSDTVVLDQALNTLVQFMEQHAEAGAVAPRLVRPDGSPQPYAFGDDPTIGYLLARGLRRVLFKRYLHNWAEPGTRTVHWVSGACLLVRQAAIEQVGLLDENIFMYFEDNDWCLRLRRAGWKIFVVDEAAVMHHGGQSLAKNPAARQAYAQSLRYFYRKHYSPVAQVLLGLLLPIYQHLAT